ncbi:MAG: hypothetical protein ACRERD_15195 [Candidatus Binatia bacterium]
MSDVTALVLSLGEDYTDRAIASVRRQAFPAVETIVVRGISPFHHAFQSGVACVRTAFFIQVDADMILDSTCIKDLRDCVSDGVGIIVGHLRDPLLNRAVGIKLFRTQSCGRVRHRDSVSSETDFVGDIEREGWTTVYALQYSEASPARWHTFGEHCPDYNPHYTFCKFVRDGAKARYRKAGGGIRGLFRQLQTSAHSAATVAAIAAAHGIFVKERRDLHGPYTHSEESEFLERFLMAPKGAEAAPAIHGDLVQGDLRKGFKRSFELGIRLRRYSASTTFLTCLRQLHQQGDVASWVTLVGLCHGLFVDEYNDAEAEEAFALLRELLPG